MKHISAHELRRKFIEFFVKKHTHAEIRSASLIPDNDPTVLFTTAGMHPLVPFLIGEKHPKGTRLVDVQKCVRTGDIDEVGDLTHLTFFEMLGNWSLGDYFKEGAIRMSHEFLTGELGIDQNMLAISCFEGDADAPKDEEAADIWKNFGYPEERIAFLPKSENWWGPAGQTGPCGPDTEMFYWTGDKPAPEKFDPSDDRWVEIWNDVFMQYDKQADGSFQALEQKNVDTGMGLERTLAVLTGKKTPYETELFSDVMAKIAELTKDSTRVDSVKHERIIADHLRAATFILGDPIGVTPSNQDQGYVLRRLIRRAIRSAYALGVEDKFCADIAKIYIARYHEQYPELIQNQKRIVDELDREEDQFRTTLRQGEREFEKMREKLDGAKLSGEQTFHLYDTYGFPLEMTKELAAEKGLEVDEKGFAEAFEHHQETSRAGATQKFAGGLADHSEQSRKYHTATHLTLAALREILGDHVWQKGSNITQERMRFDFAHPEKMTQEQIKAVEDWVNDKIKKDLPMFYREMPIEEAEKLGATGVFGEKYGEIVKVYFVGDPEKGENISMELCGGPHVEHTGVLGHFKITKEESSSSGVRRLKAVLE